MRDFIKKMREEGLVVDVDEPVSADMQAPKMAAGTDKLLFFHNIEGARAVMNLTASRRAISLALGIDENRMVKTLADAKFDGNVKTAGIPRHEKTRSLLNSHHASFPPGCREVSHIRDSFFPV